MDAEQAKAAAFVSRLLQNPALKAISPLMKEEQIAQFLRLNGDKLYPTLSSRQFFPGQSREQIHSRLHAALKHEIDKQLAPVLNWIADDLLELSFIQFLREQNMPQDKIKENLKQFILQMLSHPEARAELVGPLNAIYYRYVGRYLEQVFERTEYVHFELTKVQRLRMGKEEIRHFVQVSLLLRPAVRLFSQSAGAGTDTAAGTIQAPFLEKVLKVLPQKLPGLPDEVLRSALFSNASFGENRSLEATARMAAVFASLCRNVRPHERVDRGAVTADKSWLNIARRNYKYYGYDIKLLDEFYKIAAENGW